jgi:Cdc6-like AAA superfamily ATPase
MTSDSSTFEYQKSLNALNIARDRDPFPFDPPRTVDYWADNRKVLQKLVQVQVDSIMFASSFIYILYGPFGGGKTFAIRYLSNPKTQKLVLGSLKRTDLEVLNIDVRAVAPVKTGQLTFSLHKEIIEKCFTAIVKSDELIRALVRSEQIGIGKIKAAFEDIRHSTTRSLDGEPRIVGLEDSDGYKLLTQARSRLGKLQDVNELVESISILVQLLSKKYGRVIISIDELENLARASVTERVICSDFLRKIHEMIEHNLTLFLLFTFDSYEVVSQVLQPALLSRVREAIEFTHVKEKSDIIDYIRECLALRSKVNPNDVIDQEVVEAIAGRLIDSFKGSLSFRDINREMHDIFSRTYISAKQPSKYKIESSVYKEAMEKVSTEDILRRIKEQTES